MNKPKSLPTVSVNHGPAFQNNTDKMSLSITEEATDYFYS